MVNLYYSPSYVGSGYSFDTTRKAKWIADSLQAQPIPGIDLVEPEPLSRAKVELVHDWQYVEAVETGNPADLAESQGFVWDAGLWPMVAASNGGAVTAAFDALEDGVAGSLSSGLHHARRDSGAGYCTFNGLVLAARAALKAGAASVLILDLDAHCGGGTRSLIRDEPRIRQIDVSVSNFDSYTPSENRSLDLIRDPKQYLPIIRRRLEEADSRGIQFDLCLYNAGMDPFEDCLVGGLAGITREVLASREQMVFEWCRNRSLPIAFVLAGGYIGGDLSQAGLVELHRLTLMSAARAA